MALRHCKSRSRDIIGFKQLADNHFAILRITKKTEAMLQNGKCRAASAEVLVIIDEDGKRVKGEIDSSYTSSFQYKEGDVVVPANGFSNNRYNECEAGIHFYQSVAHLNRYHNGPYERKTLNALNRLGGKYLTKSEKKKAERLAKVEAEIDKLQREDFFWKKRTLKDRAARATRELAQLTRKEKKVKARIAVLNKKLKS